MEQEGFNRAHKDREEVTDIKHSEGPFITPKTMRSLDIKHSEGPFITPKTKETSKSEVAFRRSLSPCPVLHLWLLPAVPTQCVPLFVAGGGDYQFCPPWIQMTTYKKAIQRGVGEGRRVVSLPREIRNGGLHFDMYI